MKSKTIKLVFLLVLPVMAAVLYACATTATMAAKHPMEVEAPAICSQCHTDGRAAMDHTGDFGIRHKFFAQQNSQACGICHAQSFCSDCHAHKEELKPSDKYKDSPERMLPHRGDYLNQHKIDGKINPASCIPCHGRQNNERCRTCHR
jgi:hypothetical protein